MTLWERGWAGTTGRNVRIEGDRTRISIMAHLVIFTKCPTMDNRSSSEPEERCTPTMRCHRWICSSCSLFLCVAGPHGHRVVQISRGDHHIDPTHWGQGVVYQAGTSQVHHKEMDNVPTIYLLGTSQVHSEFSQPISIQFSQPRK